MRLALFADTYPDDVNGVAKTLGKLVRHAASRGHDVALVTTRVAGGPDPSAAMHRQIPGVPAPMYPELQLARLLDRGTKRMLRDFAPDVVHVATESTVGFSGRRWALRHGLPLVTSSIRTSRPTCAITTWARWNRGSGSISAGSMPARW